MTRTALSRFSRIVILAFSCFVITLPASAVTLPTSTPAAKESTAVNPFANMSVEDFVALTPQKYRELTGKKLSFKEKLSLKFAQKKVRKAVKNNQPVDLNAMAYPVDTADFNIGGFVLGLLLSVVGVLIAYLIGDTNVIKWAWIGFGVSAILYLLILIL